MHFIVFVEIRNTVKPLSIGTDRPKQTVDPDQMPHNAASDLGLQCLPLIQHYFKHISR